MSHVRWLALGFLPNHQQYHQKKNAKKHGFSAVFVCPSKSSAPQGSCSISCGMPSGHTLESIASVGWVRTLDMAVAKGEGEGLICLKLDL